MPEGKWQGVCPAGHTSSMHRAPGRVRSCGKCTPGVFSPFHIIEWKKEGKIVLMPAKYTAEMAHLKAKYPEALADYSSNGNRRTPQEVAQLEEIFAQLDEILAMPA